jgi:hypothetical protein
VGRLYGATGRELAGGELGGGLYRSASAIQAFMGKGEACDIPQRGEDSTGEGEACDSPQGGSNSWDGL